jgi:hypothetical protein
LLKIVTEKKWELRLIAWNEKNFRGSGPQAARRALKLSPDPPGNMNSRRQARLRAAKPPEPLLPWGRPKGLPMLQDSDACLSLRGLQEVFPEASGSFRRAAGTGDFGSTGRLLSGGSAQSLPLAISCDTTLISKLSLYACPMRA